MISASGAAALTREPRSSQVLLPGTRSYLTPGKIIMAAALLTGVLAVWPAARGVNETTWPMKRAFSKKFKSNYATPP
jgi:hypothetical protein